MSEIGIGRAASSTYREAAPWVEKLARAGYAAKGVVYLLIGWLAVKAALGDGGQTSGSSGALASISDSAVGRGILAVITVGLVGYALWNAIRALMNPEGDGSAKRAFHGVVTLIYSGLALEAGRMALSGSSQSGGSDQPAHWSATLMQQPFGHWLLGAAGVGVVLYGVQQLVNAWRVDLDDQLSLGTMTEGARRATVSVGRLGIAARGIVFAIIGAYLVVAAVQSQPSEARGLDGVLDTLAQTPWLLGVIAFGLVLYGAYNLVRARYRVIRA